MTQRTKAAIFLVLAAPVLAELLTSSSPASRFFIPWYFVLQLVSYGLPVLIIRELALKWKLGIGGIFLLGVGYGIFNEGLLAGTFLQTDPSGFNGYGFYFGLSLAWAPSIAIWHALHSTLFPILIVQGLNQAVARERWVSDKVLKVLFGLSFVESLILYFSSHTLIPLYFFVFWIAILALGILASRRQGEIRQSPVRRPWLMFCAGALIITAHILLFLVSKSPAILLVYWTVLAISFGSIAGLLRKNDWLSLPALTLFGCGSYICYSIFGALLRQSPEAIVTSTSMIIVLFILFTRLKKPDTIS